MPKNIAVTLLSQEQMCVNTAFDFICLCAVTISKETNILIISPQRARKEIAKREAVQVAQSQNCKSIMFIKDGERFVPDTLKALLNGGKDIVGCKTIKNPDMLTTDLCLVDMKVFDKIKKPYFATGYRSGSIDTIPDHLHFLKNAEQEGFKAFCDESLTAMNKGLATMETPKPHVNVRHLVGGNRFGETIAISFPSPDLIYTHTASDIGQLVASNIGMVKGFVIINVQSDEIETARNISQEIAAQEKCSRLLFIDSDMRFPPETLQKLIKREKEIIGVNAAKRDGTGVPVLRKNVLNKPFKYKEGKAEKVGFIGMACTLIDMKVFEKMTKPYFYANYENNSDNWRGEDYTFCWEAKRKGFHIWCDVGLSKEIGHIGAQAYYLEVK